MDSGWTESSNGKLYMWSPIKLSGYNFDLATDNEVIDEKIMLEAFRVNIRAIITKSDDAFEALTWSHLVKMFYALDSYLLSMSSSSNGYHGTVLSERGTPNTVIADITIWFMVGVLYSGTRAYIQEDFPWRARLVMDSTAMPKSPKMNILNFERLELDDQKVTATELENLHGRRQQVNLATKSPEFEGVLSEERTLLKEEHGLNGEANTDSSLILHAMTEVQSPPEPSSFRPCRYILGENRIITTDIARDATRAGIQIDKYQGEINERKIRKALLPDHENCSLRITNIHPDISPREFFRAIHTGKVYHFFPHEPNSNYKTCAADLVFMIREGAELFLEQVNSSAGISFHGMRIRAVWNRHKEKPEKAYDLSRVLRVFGPNDDNEFLTVEGLEGFLQKAIYYTLVDSSTWICRDGTKVIELSFGSILAQGESAHLMLRRHFKNTGMNGKYYVAFAQDPCDPEQYSDEQNSVKQQLE